MPTAEKRLADVRASINEVLTFGQSIQKDGRVLKLADLNALRLLEKQYAQAAAIETKSAQRKPRNRVYYGVI